MSTEITETIQGYCLSRADTTAVLTKAMLDMREGGISSVEAQTIISAVDCQTRRMQVIINAMKLQEQLKRAGADFGEYLRNTKTIIELGCDI